MCGGGHAYYIVVQKKTTERYNIILKLNDNPHHFISSIVYFVIICFSVCLLAYCYIVFIINIILSQWLEAGPSFEIGVSTTSPSTTDFIIFSLHICKFDIWSWSKSFRHRQFFNSRYFYCQQIFIFIVFICIYKT